MYAFRKYILYSKTYLHVMALNVRCQLDGESVPSQGGLRTMPQAGGDGKTGDPYRDSLWKLSAISHIRGVN